MSSYFARPWRSRALVVFYISITGGAPAFAQQANLDYVPGEIIVKLKGKSKSMQAQAFVGKSVSEKAMNLKESWSGLNMHHFSLKPGASIEQALKELKEDPAVEYAEPNYIVKFQSVGGVEGPLLSLSAAQEKAAAENSGMSGTSQTSAPIRLADGWAAATHGLTPSVVAVIDTGVDMNHRVFSESGAIWTNTREVAGNGIDDDGNGYVDDVHGWNFADNNNSPMDDEGHGTHCAGIVLGATQDIMATPLAEAKIRIMPLKFLRADGSGSTSDAIKAIYYAVNNGANVLSNSWGGGSYSNALVEAIGYVYDQGRVFVAAAGNAASNNDAKPTYPASYAIPNMMSIAATRDDDLLATFSNYGAASVHFGAPGQSILSTFPDNTFARLSGTSMATPFIAGVAALMVREQPSMNGYQLKELLFGGGEIVNSLVGKTTEQKRLNVLGAVQAAKVASVDPSLPSYDKTGLRAPAAEAPASAEAPAMGGCGLVAKMAVDASKGKGGPPQQGPYSQFIFVGVLLAMLAPLLLSLALRNRSGAEHRRHTRYQIDSSVRLKLGDKELVGQVASISMGGVQINTDAWLEKGGVVSMSIRSPDGKDEIQVEGRIVWSEEHKRYGVAFANANQSVLTSISNWSKSLMRI